VDWKRIGIGVAAAIVVAIVVMVAFGSKTIDNEDLEADLADQVTMEFNVDGGEDVEVSCPDDVEVEAGKEFECDATIDGEHATTVRIRLTDDDGGYQRAFTR
jgi:Domain of unknown function (DUF4333)